MADPPPLDRASDQSAGQLLFRARLFVSAYSLLFFLLALKFDTGWLQLSFFALTIVGWIEGLRLTFWYSQKAARYTYTIDKVEDSGTAVNGFLASHLLPFLAPGSPTTRDLVAYLVFFIVLLLVSINSDLAHINPVLYILGRRVVRITTAGAPRILVCRRPPLPGDQVSAVRLSGGLVEALRRERA